VVRLGTQVVDEVRAHLIELRGAAERKRLMARMELLPARGTALGAAAVVLLLGLVSLPLAQARLDLSFTAGLPHDDGVAEGAELLDAAGIRGISAPTEVLSNLRYDDKDPHVDNYQIAAVVRAGADEPLAASDSAIRLGW
jgi:uncharacterized membrane protein YdfJ with MMPL/SSD domain